MKVLGIDPGGTTGWAVIEDLELQLAGQVKADNFHFWLSNLATDFDVIVVEDYKIRPDKLIGHYDHAWSSGQTMRFIGALQYWAYANGIKLELQQPVIKPVAAGWTGLPYIKGKKDMHHVDATLHAAYYLVNRCGVTPGDFKKIHSGK